MVLWKCSNCDNEFLSETEDDFIEDTKNHISDCINICDLNNMFKILESELNKSEVTPDVRED